MQCHQRRSQHSLQRSTVQAPCQPINIFGELNGGVVTVTANLGSNSGVPNLFGKPAPVYVGKVPAGASNSAPMATAHARGAPAARVDKGGSETAL